MSLVYTTDEGSDLSNIKKIHYEKIFFSLNSFFFAIVSFFCILSILDCLHSLIYIKKN